MSVNFPGRLRAPLTLAGPEEEIEERDCLNDDLLFLDDDLRKQMASVIRSMMIGHESKEPDQDKFNEKLELYKTVAGNNKDIKELFSIDCENKDAE